MGYLPGDIRIFYEEAVCVGCLHAGDMENYMCPVIRAHFLSQDPGGPAREALQFIIPEVKGGDPNEIDGTRNAKCLMWARPQRPNDWRVSDGMPQVLRGNQFHPVGE